MTWLFVARALQGVGGGGIVTLVWVILDEVAPAKTRHRWNAALTVVWSASALAGPLLGGVFSASHILVMDATDLVSWRWAFYINLPVGCVALIAAVFSLSAWKEAPCSQLSTYDLLATFDWVGLVLLVGGTASLVFGFILATAEGWTAKITLVLLGVGVVMLTLGAIYENCSRHEQPAVHGSSALLAGLELLPYTLGSSLVSLIGFYVTEKTKAHNTIIRVGLAIMATGFGSFLDPETICRSNAFANRPNDLAGRKFKPCYAGLDSFGGWVRSGVTAQNACNGTRIRYAGVRYPCRNWRLVLGSFYRGFIGSVRGGSDLREPTRCYLASGV
ncbi:hypothetical protein FRC10_004030 [Ceratobasidium sp. 414]|nr:hypothetical protein FRC10_004030 [Ceratobasidium sp. 414]